MDESLAIGDGPASESRPRGHGERPLAPERGRAALLGEVERIAKLGGFVWSRGATLYWSDELYRMLGYEPGSVTPSEEAFFSVVHPDDRERVRAGWGAARQGRLGGVEYRIVHQVTQEVRHVRASGQPFEEGGEVQEIVGAVQDITEAKLRAVALEEARAVASAAERVAGVGSFVLRVGGSDAGVRPVAAARDGLSGEPSLPEPLHAEDQDKHARWWQGLAREGAIEPLRVRVTKPDGGVRHLETSAVRVRLGSGEERIVGTTVDISERVLLEERLEHAAKMEAFGTLSAGVAHDFNNYLLVIDQSLSLLLDSEGAERDELVASGRLALGRARGLTRQLLALARRQPFRPLEVDLCRVVRDFSELLERAVGRRATLRMEPSGAGFWSRVDPHHVERMLTNLVVNAADAIEDTRRARGLCGAGNIRIRVQGVRLAAARPAAPRDVPAGSYVCVEIDDDGGGIEPARLPYIFEPFYTSKVQGRGTGLGLASVHAMVRQNDGFVTVSALQGGTRFTLWLPRLASGAAGPRGPSCAEARALSPAGSPRGAVLVVADGEAVCEASLRILRGAGFGALGARCVGEALELIAAGAEPRLVIADLDLPRRGARELCEALRERPGAPPTVFLTGYGDVAPPEGAEHAQVLLAKPFTPERLIDFVQRALHMTRAA